MLPLSPSQIPNLVAEAQAHEAAGRLEEARKLYATILTVDRGLAQAHYQHGRLCYRLDRLADAADSLERAAALKPDETAIWQLYAKTLVRLGAPDRTDLFLRKIKRASLDAPTRLALQETVRPPAGQRAVGTGSAPPGKVRAAIAALQAGDARGAERIASALWKAHPDTAMVANILGNALAAQKRPEAAETHFRAAIALQKDFAEAQANLGRLLVGRGEIEAGIGHLRKAVKIAPDLSPAWLHLGKGLIRQGRDLPGAVAALRRAVDADPMHPAPLLELGRALMLDRQHETAIDTLRQALQAGADEIDARLCLARALADSGQAEAALEEVATVLERQADCGPALSTRAAILQMLGRFDAARADFRRALDLMPRVGEVYRVFLTTETPAADEPLIGRMESLFADPTLPDADRASIGFALGKAMADTRQHHRVFDYLRPANDLMRRLYPYDVEDLHREMTAVRRAFEGVDLAPIPGAPRFGPIFVTGLPRSGTTLVEQIVASHSRVTGGGELGFAREEIDRACRGPDRTLRRWTDVPPEALRQAAAATERRMRARCPGADIITDKSVWSYVLIGALRAVLPGCRIVVVRRDPRDTALSLYRNRFADGTHLYSYSLRDLATACRVFDETVAFWRNLVPEGFHEVRYEDLIAAPEAQTRQLIAACGLDWEEACLDFHKTARRVDTLSVHQVRQPLYSSSVGQWRRYKEHLGPLFEALGEGYGPED